MNTEAPAWRRRRTAVLSVGLSAALIVATPAIPALAAPTILPASDTSDLVIHKSSAPEGTAGDGTLESPDPGLGYEIENVGYTIWRVTYDPDGAGVLPAAPIDLMTNAGWQQAAALATALGAFDATDDWAAAKAVIEAVSGYSLVAETPDDIVSFTGLTDVDGVLSFDDISNGLYLVIETDPPANAIQPTVPFLVTLPITDPVNLDEWLYTVHVYPKNQITALEKTVTDADAVVEGDEVTYTIVASRPTFETTSLVITDELDAKLDYVASSLVVTVPDGPDGDSDPDVLIPGTDYSLDTTGDIITVTLLAPGIVIFNALDVGDELTVTFDVTVNAAGQIPNSAEIVFNGGTAIPSTEEPETHWGDLEIEKFQQDGSTALNGAKFAVFTSEADALAATIVNYATTAIDFGGQQLFETGVDGAVASDGKIVFPAALRYSDFADGVAVTDVDPGYRSYWIVELEAPAGYELLAQPIEVVLNEAVEIVGITNVPQNAGFQLPFTGGAGTAIFYLAGGGLIALTVILFVVFGSKRRREHEVH